MRFPTEKMIGSRQFPSAYNRRKGSEERNKVSNNNITLISTGILMNLRTNRSLLKYTERLRLITGKEREEFKSK